MTLQEAHEIQRRELISLRHKVAKLEKQVSEDALPISVKKELEHEIRSRDYEITCLKKELRGAASKYDDLKRQYDLAKDEAFESFVLKRALKQDNDCLLKENTFLKDKVAKLEAEVSMLNGTNA